MWSGAAAVVLMGQSTLAAGTANLPDEKAKAAVDEIFADLTAPGAPGCALAVARDGKTVYEKGYGLASIEQNEIGRAHV